MKLLSFVEFCELPDGAVFQEFEPCFLSDICIRGSVLWDDDGKPIDFTYRTASPDLRFDERGIFLVWQESYGRWGNFRYSTKFIVYEDADKDAFVKRLYTPHFYDDLEDEIILELPEEDSYAK